jgi:hypothetical protein
MQALCTEKDSKVLWHKQRRPPTAGQVTVIGILCLASLDKEKDPTTSSSSRGPILAREKGM